MEYHLIPGLIAEHRERIRRCESILNEYKQYGCPATQQKLRFSAQVDERYLKVDLEENIKFLEGLVVNSTKAIVQLEKQHARLQEVSQAFK